MLPITTAVLIRPSCRVVTTSRNCQISTPIHSLMFQVVKPVLWGRTGEQLGLHSSRCLLEMAALTWLCKLPWSSQPTRKPRNWEKSSYFWLRRRWESSRGPGNTRSTLTCLGVTQSSSVPTLMDQVATQSTIKSSRRVKKRPGIVISVEWITNRFLVTISQVNMTTWRVIFVIRSFFLWFRGTFRAPLTTIRTIYVCNNGRLMWWMPPKKWSRIKLWGVRLPIISFRTKAECWFSPARKPRLTILIRYLCRVRVTRGPEIGVRASVSPTPWIKMEGFNIWSRSRLKVRGRSSRQNCAIRNSIESLAIIRIKKSSLLKSWIASHQK